MILVGARFGAVVADSVDLRGCWFCTVGVGSQFHGVIEALRHGGDGCPVALLKRFGGDGCSVGLVKGFGGDGCPVLLLKRFEGDGCPVALLKRSGSVTSA